MPTLNRIGKEAVVKHHKEVPFRLLEPVPDLSCGDADSGNLIVQGDNLHALKALLPRYAGQVKCTAPHASARFYPDFLCQLPDTADKPGAIQAVEYKGADRWTAAKDDRLIGGLWANMSEGRCRFVMIKNKRWEWIEPLLQ